MKKDYITQFVIAAFVTLIVVAFISPRVHAQVLRIFTPSQGGTGIGTATGGDVGKCLKVLSDSPFTYELGACGTGGGGGSGTDTLFNWNSSTNIISTDGASTTATTSLSTNGFTANTATVTSATTTNFFSSILTATNGFISSLIGTNATVTSATTTRLYTSALGLNSEYFTDLTGTGLQNTNGVLTLNATGDWTGTLDGFEGATLAQGNWLFDGTRLTPSSTVGISVNASSSIFSLNVVNGTTTNATSTRQYTSLFGLNSEYFSDLTGSGLLNTGGALTLDSSIVRGLFSDTIDGITYTSGTGVFSLDSGYVIPTTTRLSNLDSFYNTPSTVITAGTGIDWSGNTLNGVYTAGDGLTLTAEDFDCDTASGSVFGCLLSGDWTVFNNKVSSSSIDTSSELRTLVTDEVGTGALMFGITATMSDDISCGASQVLARNSSDNAWECVAASAGGGGGGGGWATTTGDNAESGELLTYTSNDVLIGGSAPASAEFNFDPETSRFTISSTTASATGTIDSVLNALRFGSTTREQVELNWNNTDTLRLFSSTGVSLFDFGSIAFTATSGTTTNFFATNASTSNFWGAGLSSCSGANKVTWTNGKFGCDTDQTGAGGGSSNWILNIAGDSLTPSTTKGISINASSTIDALTMRISTTTNATSSRLYTALLGLNSEYFSDLTGTGLQNSGGVLTLNATGDWTGTLDGFEGASLAQTNWLFNGTRLTPSTTVGIGVFASSTISDLSMTNATATNATTTNFRTTQLGVGSDFLTDITGTGITIASGALTASLGTDIAAAEIANGDHGFFSYSGGTASLDTGGLTSANLSGALTDETGSGFAVFSGSPTFTGGATFTGINVSATSTLGFASSSALTVSGATYLNTFTANSGTTTNATSTNLSVSGTLKLFGGAAVTSANGLCIQLTGSADLCDGSDGGGAGGGSSNWVRNADLSAITPSTTVGILVNASSTIDALTARLGTTTNATSTSLFSTLGTFTNMIVNTLATFFNVVVTGLLDVGGGVLEIPNGTAPVSDDVGEISHDTTDNQLILDDFVVARANDKIWGVTVASTSVAFANAGLLKVPTEQDGYTITGIRCSVSGGTSKVIAVEDESTNSTEDITCATSVTSDDGSITNATVTAGEEMYIDFGATSGTVDYVSVTVYGQWTRE